MTDTRMPRDQQLAHTPKVIPPKTSWWVDVPRADWQKTVNAHSVVKRSQEPGYGRPGSVRGE